MSKYRSACIAFLGWFLACYAVTATVRSLVRAPAQQDSALTSQASQKASMEDLKKSVTKESDALCGVDGMPLTMQETVPNELIAITISPESRVKATCSGEQPRLHEREWREFSISIDNAAGITAPLTVDSEQLILGEENEDRHRWLRLEIEPNGNLSGERLETRKIRLWSRDAGYRAAVLQFNAGQGTQDLGFRSDVLVVFRSESK